MIIERALEADALVLARKIFSIRDLLGVTAAAALGAIAARLEAGARLRAAFVRIDEAGEAEAAEAAGRLAVLLIGGHASEREEELVHFLQVLRGDELDSRRASTLSRGGRRADNSELVSRGASTVSREQTRGYSLRLPRSGGAG